MKVQALLLADASEQSVADKLEKLLAFFGVACDRIAPTDFSTYVGDKVGILCTAATLLKVLGQPVMDSRTADVWRDRVYSVFAVADVDQNSLQSLIQNITGGISVSVAEVTHETKWEISDQLPEFCASMSGVRVSAAQSNATVLSCNEESQSNVTRIISNGCLAGFVRVKFRGVPVFLSTAGVIDIAAPLAARNFDIRKHFLSALPAVLYIKWAFPETCWRGVETGACLVIDDPLLQRRYGYLNYQNLLGLMQRVNFSTSIAFIPWNWKRSARKTIRLFKENAPRFSLSIHGCDHTNFEFGGENRERLAWKARQAILRMANHQARTGLPHDNVMVFPQGVFSEAAMDAVKHSNFIGVVNSEVVSSDRRRRTISISDYWDVAVRNYGAFPIFPRRYRSDGIENFAFDILLGKPCIIVVHHNDCYDDCRHIAEFIGKLNKINARFRWTTLAEIIRRSVREREVAPNVCEIEMYGVEATVENTSAQRIIYRFRKRESAPGEIREIVAATQPVKWTANGNQISFEIGVDSGQSATVAVKYSEVAVGAFSGESLRYRVKAMVRRYLCEVRDNYLMRKLPSH